MGLLDEKRSLIILAKIVDTGIIIPKDIVTELLHPVHDLLMLEEMYKLLTNRKTNKKNWTSSLLPKYISLLYRNNHDVMRLPQTVFPWDHGIQNQQGKYKGFDSTVEYARYLYWNHVPTKSIYYVGLMLEGEAKANHKNVFSLYKSELLDKNLSPNIQCLGVLLQVATKLGTTQVWNGLTPPQVAINQFQTHVKADASAFGIMPDDLLWKKYIELLSKYQYISEVSKIMKWWEDLKYNPPKDVLVVLLSALPEEYAKRHIEHISKLKRETKTVAKPNWEWPTYEEYEDYKSRNRV
ncbi:uncharacterized protein SPAPADRAFT_62474 [Spathaspora passalidarum NRRL Y-27907]|uniref:Uncharacterized protein n=1 Tax=Spathaspora passalidarum (strain NRRL Y-27907 / 11-Y1) TaxID=619300 RepID=G3AS14_SPAPN|nr:uncharacterized protein SPAPADRAFT_62474 [Spathaspora passalidarum NRRL Y-27907]EGW31863.1 hypothetical protein SPAPADRAFT_62474 [Spathaspora passalidarum NRRL Y-27907]